MRRFTLGFALVLTTVAPLTPATAGEIAQVFPGATFLNGNGFSTSFVSTSMPLGFEVTKAFNLQGLVVHDTTFRITPSGGVNEYLFQETVTNNSGVPWGQYQLDLAATTLPIFVADHDFDSDLVIDRFDNSPYTPNSSQSNNDGDGVGDVSDPDVTGDGVVDAGFVPFSLSLFDSTAATFDTDDMMPAPTSSLFPSLSHLDRRLLWSGAVVNPGESFTIGFSIDVPDGIGGINLRQAPVPEPTSLCLLAVGIGGFCVFSTLRRRTSTR